MTEGFFYLFPWDDPVLVICSLLLCFCYNSTIASGVLADGLDPLLTAVTIYVVIHARPELT